MKIFICFNILTIANVFDMVDNFLKNCIVSCIILCKCKKYLLKNLCFLIVLRVSWKIMTPSPKKVPKKSFVQNFYKETI